ncbi:GNAT family N-acetyltransferase [Devosia sp.]|uniref:GNAT family N-acetyltransferase n=1 Tax=Devosia sp. TaxID=1871048 RepID=UPI003A90B6DC
MSAVLIASITALCADDHHADPKHIAAWTANKAPEGVARMLAHARLMLVAECDGELAAVGCLNRDDEIGLNYVAPWARFRGVSKALLAVLEQAMQSRGATIGRLESTRTAHRFYRAAGWRDAVADASAAQSAGIPMEKRLG